VSKGSRRILYRRDGDDRFPRRLEFSTDGGATWWLRAETVYTRVDPR